MEECDHAYEQSVVKREYYLELLEKFDRYAVTAYAYNGTVLGYIVFYSTGRVFKGNGRYRAI